MIKRLEEEPTISDANVQALSPPVPGDLYVFTDPDPLEVPSIELYIKVIPSISVVRLSMYIHPKAPQGQFTLEHGVLGRKHSTLIQLASDAES